MRQTMWSPFLAGHALTPMGDQTKVEVSQNVYNNVA